jgi:hypothetical protein
LPPAAPPATDPLAGQHVLLVGIHYPPEPVGAGPWTARIAEQLATRAASVTVVSGLPHYPDWCIDEPYRGLSRLVLPPADGAGPTLVRLGHHVPARWTARSSARYQVSFARRALTTRLRQRPDIVVGVTPSPGAAFAAARLARRHDARLVVAVQSLVDRAGGPALARRLERYALQHADRVLVTNRALAPAVATLGVPYERITTLVADLYGVNGAEGQTGPRP